MEKNVIQLSFKVLCMKPLLMKVLQPFKQSFGVLQSLINGAEKDFLLMLLRMGLHANNKQLAPTR